MKKIIFLLIVLIIPIQVYAISASSAVVIDQDSNRVIFNQNMNKKSLIASTTKIMTAIIAIENGNLNKTITVDENVLKAYGSAIYIEVGEKITLKDLLYGLMLRSGNDAAIVIANNICKDQKQFVKLMNKKAIDIGMKNTNFVNPHGLEENDGSANISTAYDMALLMSYAMKNKTFAKITGTQKYITKSDKKSYVWQNKNKLLRNYEYTTGGKTGYTKKAKRTLVSSAQKNNKKLIIVTLNDPNDFSNHQKLYEEYFNKYNLVTVVDSSKYRIKDNEYKNKRLCIKKDIKILLTKEEERNIRINIDINKKNKFNNSKVAGYLSVCVKDKVLVKRKIFIKEKRTKKNKNSLSKKIKSWFS